MTVDIPPLGPASDRLEEALARRRSAPADGRLREAFSDSPLPWKVDVVDRARADAAFRICLRGRCATLRSAEE
jgi:hypothetical protein